jgi:adenylate cyclase
MPLALVSPTGDRRFVLPEGSTLSLGRDTTCDVPILDPGVSRRHAEMRVVDGRVAIADLGSRNGTWLNGRRIQRGDASVGDLIGFGPVELAVVEEAAPRVSETAPFALDGAATMVRERAMRSPREAVEAVAGRRLAQLVAVAQRLGGLAQLDALLPRIVDDAFEAFAADRVAVLLMGEGQQLETRIARDRDGQAVPRPVPRSIAQGVAERQVSWLMHDARQDPRAAGESIVHQAVRSALAVPLIGEGQRTLGVLYVDNLRDAHAFTASDLDFLVAYAGIAAAAMEREANVERLREATRVRENFERYFTPQLADRIAAQRGDVMLGGERRSVVVLFSDIRGFTEVAERLPPDQMAAQLNEYFAAMVECVFRHDGALDKFIGDALMAYWGAPVATPDDADRAIRAALDMQDALRALNARWTASGRPALQAGIGINAGDAFVGNIGAPRRLEYTLIGDTVNLASRLCGLARGGEVLVTDAVRTRVTQPFTMVHRPELVPERHRGPAVAVHAVHRSLEVDTATTEAHPVRVADPLAPSAAPTTSSPAHDR